MNVPGWFGEAADHLYPDCRKIIGEPRRYPIGVDPYGTDICRRCAKRWQREHEINPMTAPAIVADATATCLHCNEPLERLVVALSDATVWAHCLSFNTHRISCAPREATPAPGSIEVNP